MIRKRYDDPLLSVITVCLNSENTIHKTLHSVDIQTYENFEHIIIDGCSNDRTLKIISSYNSKKRLVFSEHDNGIYHAMNKGLKKASGQYVIFLNSDDYFSDRFVLQEIIDKIKLTRAQVIYSGISYINSHGNIISTWLPLQFKKGSYKIGFHTPHPGFFADRTLYKKLGDFDLSMPVYADFELMFRFMENDSVSCERLNRVTVVMRSDGLSSSLQNIFRGLIDITKSFKKNGKLKYLLSHMFFRYTKKIKRKLLNIIFSIKK